LFGKKNLDEITQEEMNQNIAALEKIYEAITDLNRRNDQLKSKYENDEKFARIHKMILREKNINAREILIFETLNDIKKEADQKVLNMNHVVDNPEFFSAFMSPIVIDNFMNHGIKLDSVSAERVNNFATEEYLYAFNGTKTW
jgi:type I restriction enzyme, R subunit